MLLTYVLSLGHTCHILPRLVVVGLCWVGEFLFSRAINGNSVYFWVIYTDLHTHCHQNILTKACIQLQLVMHNARSLLGVSSSICPAQSRQGLIFAERRQAVLPMSVLCYPCIVLPMYCEGLGVFHTTLANADYSV